MEPTESKSELSLNEVNSIDIIDIGELSWSDRLRPKPKIQGKYLRGDILGQGTFAKVYEVMDIQTLERRAVKIFDMHKIDRRFNRDEMVKMVNQEIALLASCNHRHVIKMIDVHRSYPVNSEQTSKKDKSSSSMEMESLKSSLLGVVKKSSKTSKKPSKTEVSRILYGLRFGNNEHVQ